MSYAQRMDGTFPCAQRMDSVFPCRNYAISTQINRRNGGTDQKIEYVEKRNVDTFRDLLELMAYSRRKCLL